MPSAPADPGTLYLVATPIGNLGDLSHRAVELLKSVDRIVAEDTRVSRRLLDHYGVGARPTAYHDHNKEQVTPRLLGKLEEGLSVALLTDAGTPGISDPGFYLTRRAIGRGIPVTTLPGPSAVISALVISGLPTDAFVFLGYLPRKSGPAGRILERAIAEGRTLVYFDSPHRFLKNLGLLAQLAPGARVAACREMTKKFEEVVRGTAAEMVRAMESRNLKGEITVVVDPREA